MANFNYQASGNDLDKGRVPSFILGGCATGDCRALVTKPCPIVALGRHRSPYCVDDGHRSAREWARPDD
jgi:hypothetical protein